MRRADGTNHTVRHGAWRRLTLRRADGTVYLDRWGFAHERIGRVLLHRMDAPDPGRDLHDHPWSFLSVVLWGGYTELRALSREAPGLAAIAERYPSADRGVVEHRRPGSIRVLRLDECHTITRLHRRRCWTLVVGGPRRRSWGFYLPEGWMDEGTYDRTVRADRRDLWPDQNGVGRPW